MKNATILTGLFLFLSLLLPAQKLERKKINGKYGFVDASGQEIISPVYDIASDFSEGLAAVMKKKKWGYIDAKGDIVIPFNYQYALGFNESLAQVQLNDKWGYIDRSGKEIIPFKYESAYAFQEGMAVVQLNGKWGFIDKTNQIIIPIKYDAAEEFKEGLAQVELNDKWGYIDKTNHIIIPFKYDYANKFKEGIAKVKLNGITYYIDKSGVVVWFQEELVSNPVKSNSPINYGKVSGQELKSTRIYDKYGFVDKGGKIIISPQYDDAKDFSEGLAPVMLGNRWGFINAADKVEIPIIYTNAENFSNGLAKVCQNGYWGFIDKNFIAKIPIKYDEATRYSKKYSEDVFIVRLNGTVSYLNRYGSELSKTESLRIEKELNDIKIELAGVVKETILGNMVIEKKIDESGTILTIGDQPVNLKFSSYKNLSNSDMYVFNIGSEKNIYFKSGNKAIKCSYTLPTYDQFHYISMPRIPWPGEVNPVPEILMKIGDKLTIINAFNGKTKTLPFELNYYNNSIIYNNEDYTIDRFINHAHINFMSAQLNCKACEGHGYIQMKDEYETITKTTYKEVVKLAPTYSEYRKHDVIHKKVPVTTTEKVLKRGKSETCKQCKGLGIVKSAKYIHWDGEKLSTISK